MNAKKRNQNLTVPNFLSVFRIIIAPIFAYYFVMDNLPVAISLILVSAFSDFIDGFIARKFNQITELGKILDPFADKLTQISVGISLAIKFKFLIPILIIFLVKEVSMVILASVLIKRMKKPCPAKWYGKVSTALFYLSVSVIVLLYYLNVGKDILLYTSVSMLSVTAVMMIYSAISYFAIFRHILNSDSKSHVFNLKKEITTK